MKRSTIFVLALIPVVIITALIVVSSLSTDDTSSSGDSVTEPSSTPTTQDVEATAVEAAEIMTTWTPHEDFNRTAAEQRAEHLMTDDRADQIVAPEREASGEGWRTAADQNATSRPSVQLNNQTETQDGMVSVFASWQWITDDGEVLGTGPQERIYYFTFDDQGKIHDYTYETVRER